MDSDQTANADSPLRETHPAFDRARELGSNQQPSPGRLWETALQAGREGFSRDQWLRWNVGGRRVE